MLHVGCKQIRLYVYTTMCLHHVPWYAKRATGIQTVASSEPEVYKPGAGNHWRVVCVGAVPLKPSNHAITLHFVTLFNLRKETLFRGLNIGLCPRTFVTLNLESVSFLILKTGHTIMSAAQQQGSHPAALYIRLSQISKCPQEPNIILRIFSGGQSCHLINSVLSTSFPTDNTVSV